MGEGVLPAPEPEHYPVYRLAATCSVYRNVDTAAPAKLPGMRKNPVRRLERILARRIREVAATKEIPLSHVADRAGLSRSLLWETFAAEPRAA